ncbi:MAG TPA: M23 family metallopeptidase [Thermoanaerobaculia bacterium]|nr:M23 family metallopeptidase [Thermoanaerobaculia bacterium]
MRTRGAFLFLAGFLVGGLFVYYLLWRTGGLTTGHPLTLTSREVADRVVATPAPPPTIPFPTPTESAPRPTPDAAAAVTPAAATTPSLSAFSLAGEVLAMPVEGAGRRDLHDSFSESRDGRRHEAIDILAPRGTPVNAAVDGSIAKLFSSVRGGLTIYEFDRTSNYCYYYAHLDRYAEGLHDGQLVRRGQLIGYVGTTGDAPPQTPHLHFSILKLGPDHRWWEGVAIDPYPALLAAAAAAEGKG